MFFSVVTDRIIIPSTATGATAPWPSTGHAGAPSWREASPTAPGPARGTAISTDSAAVATRATVVAASATATGSSDASRATAAVRASANASAAAAVRATATATATAGRLARRRLGPAPQLGSETR